MLVDKNSQCFGVAVYGYRHNAFSSGQNISLIDPTLKQIALSHGGKNVLVQSIKADARSHQFLINGQMPSAEDMSASVLSNQVIS